MDYVIADLWQLQQYQIAFKQDRRLLKASVDVIDKLYANQEYGIIGFKDGVILMQEAVASNPEATAFWLAFRREIEPILKQ
jgi:hypothetical protein